MEVNPTLLLPLVLLPSRSPQFLQTKVDRDVHQANTPYGARQDSDLDHSLQMSYPLLRVGERVKEVKARIGSRWPRRVESGNLVEKMGSRGVGRERKLKVWRLLRYFGCAFVRKLGDAWVNRW